jgi:hypothetical protein
MLTVGWYGMVTGQSIVLYSRLHLVLRNPKVLRRVLYMIIMNVFLLHVPTTVLTYGSNGSLNKETFMRGYGVMEKLQMTGFCIQEFIISGLYIRETIRLLRVSLDQRKRKVMYQLLGVNIIIVLMDIGLGMFCLITFA